MYKYYWNRNNLIKSDDLISNNIKKDDVIDDLDIPINIPINNSLPALRKRSSIDRAIKQADNDNIKINTEVDNGQGNDENSYDELDDMISSNNDDEEVSSDGNEQSKDRNTNIPNISITARQLRYYKPENDTN
eukprot:CAMPEP_0196764250 /NCGR_PEP_ID=MMETSP1095-20130614/5732_1 /TAXON_ID=96789 ORGANISM="Chromulina nebulosa, Strain UTEXLB2642" /NCGR_SAMPLE_ID=MMETSP1095 /ASSEMBLY_ACC=CAM_ASM_000446 /LENGTH=132 /DNA_ID=CAMNT_0042119343 /DNA_START=4860 /DNA_END=5258 /DNA_ORIENTATION=+